VVLEIPAVIHPIGMYSTSEDDAGRAYLSAQAAVNSLSTRCTPPCSAIVKSKLEVAQKNLAAAEYFLKDCSGDLCRLSQYYSARARELVSEGLRL
jgi:hypothetical protein